MPMIEEQHLIPYHTNPLPSGKNWLVFAPHADDETFGMGGTLLLARQQSIQTSLAIMTNGRLGIADKEKQQAETIRRREAQQAAQLLGLESVTFVDEEDRALSINEHTLEKVTDIIQQQQPDCVFIPAPLELHPDHRATTQLVWQALQAVAFKGALYGYEISGQGPINTLIDISPVASAKHEVMQVYQSQVQQNNYIEVVQALDKARTYTLESQVKYAEGFLKLSASGQDSPIAQAYHLLARYFPTAEHASAHLKLDLEEKIVQLETTNRQLLQSSSWKITRPLRWLKKQLSN